MRWLPIIFSALLVGCVADLEPVFVPAYDEGFIVGSQPLVDSARKDIIDGVYSVDAASNIREFGEQVAVRLTSDGELDIYSTQGVSFMATQGGTRNDSGVFVGFWRSVQGSSTGTVQFVVLPNEGGTELSEGKKLNKDLVLRGEVHVQAEGRTRSFVLHRKAKLNDDLRDFQIIAHRGGGRNSERLGVSENSIEMIQRARRLGSTSIEIDVLVTRDGVPIVFHDATFTPRTIRGSYIIGDVSNYTLEQLNRYARLINGEKIPTLEQALDAVINDTDLEMVWLDVKEPQVTDATLMIQNRAMDLAKERGRNVRFLFGIPSDDVLEAYQRSTFKGQAETLCELSADVALSIDANVWATRFTGGVQVATAQRMRDAGKDVYVWTLDDPEFIDTFLRERYKGGALYNGILTNYPTLLAARFYTNKAKL